MYFFTMTVVDWVDVFTRRLYSDIIIDSIRHCQETRGLVVYAYVIMPSHVPRWSGYAIPTFEY